MDERTTYRQYIGARYVPKFFENSATGTSEWASGVQYEPLTIVTWNQNNYTSKKAVPASVGAPNINPDYWVLTGNYNSQVGELTEQVNTIQQTVQAQSQTIGTLQTTVSGMSDTVSDLDTTVGGLEDTVEGLESDVSTIDGRVDTLEGDVADIQDAIGSLELDKEYLVVLGDSWADAAHDSNVQVNILATRLGLTLKNYSYGGTGFDVTNGYNEQLDDFIADTSFNHAKVKYVVLIAGLNEYHSLSSNEFAAKLNAYAQRVKGAVSCPFYWFHNYSLENDMTTKARSTKYYPQYEYYENIIRNLSRDVHTSLTFGWVHASNWNTSNYFHPNANGSNQYFNNVANAIMGTPPIIYMYDTFTLYWTGTPSEAFRRVYIDMNLVGSDLNAFVRTTCGGAVSIPNNSTPLITSRPLPCNVTPSLIVDGVLFSGSGGTPTLEIANPTAKANSTWTVGMSGYASIFAKGY